MNTYWLIEWPQQPAPLTYLHPSPEWLSRGVRDWTVDSVRVEKWTNDVQKAIRFPSKEDAEAVIGWLWGLNHETHVATEHEDVGDCSPVESVPVSVLEKLETELRETAETIAGTASAAGVLACADRLSAVIRGTKT